MAAIRATPLPAHPAGTSCGCGAPTTLRVALKDGAATTVHLAAFELEQTEVCVVSLPRATPLRAWCSEVGIQDALVGGFFTRVTGRPLGELWLAGIERQSTPFMSPWGSLRSCLLVEDGLVRLARRPDLPECPSGDLLQAGPLLVEEGRPVVVDGVDTEGFSAGRAQFDTNITVGRHPRAALGLADGIALALTCDGRAPLDSGLTLAELAELMTFLGAETALNLDGGGSATMVCGGELVNQPREQDGEPIPNGRPVATAVTFTPRPQGARENGHAFVAV